MCHVGGSPLLGNPYRMLHRDGLSVLRSARLCIAPAAAVAVHPAPPGVAHLDGHLLAIDPVAGLLLPMAHRGAADPQPAARRQGLLALLHAGQQQHHLVVGELAQLAQNRQVLFPHLSPSLAARLRAPAPRPAPRRCHPPAGSRSRCRTPPPGRQVPRCGAYRSVGESAAGLRQRPPPGPGPA